MIDQLKRLIGFRSVPSLESIIAAYQKTQADLRDFIDDRDVELDTIESEIMDAQDHYRKISDEQERAARILKRLEEFLDD